MGLVLSQAVLQRGVVTGQYTFSPSSIVHVSNTFFEQSWWLSYFTTIKPYFHSFNGFVRHFIFKAWTIKEDPCSRGYRKLVLNRLYGFIRVSVSSNGLPCCPGSTVTKSLSVTLIQKSMSLFAQKSCAIAHLICMHNYCGSSCKSGVCTPSCQGNDYLHALGYNMIRSGRLQKQTVF